MIKINNIPCVILKQYGDIITGNKGVITYYKVLYKEDILLVYIERNSKGKEISRNFSFYQLDYIETYIKERNEWWKKEIL